MNREYHKWHSLALGRDMELLVFGHGGKAILFFPTRMARFYDYENWGIIAALYEKIEAGEMQIFCVDSIDAESFYNKELTPAARIKRHMLYEKYLLKEVLPFMKKKNKGNHIIAAGCSMGAYHAVNLALKHPTLFKKAVGMSGRYDLTRQIQDFNDLFGGFHNQDIYFNMPLQFIANMHDKTLLAALRKLEIILAIGETDPFINNNKEFSQLLNNKGIPHKLYIWQDYAHRPRYWRQMVKLYL